MNDFARYCLVMARQCREFRHSMLLRWKYHRDRWALKRAAKLRAEERDYLVKARRHGYGN